MKQHDPLCPAHPPQMGECSCSGSETTDEPKVRIKLGRVAMDSTVHIDGHDVTRYVQGVTARCVSAGPHLGLTRVRLTLVPGAASVWVEPDAEHVRALLRKAQG